MRNWIIPYILASRSLLPAPCFPLIASRFSLLAPPFTLHSPLSVSPCPRVTPFHAFASSHNLVIPLTGSSRKLRVKPVFAPSAFRLPAFRLPSSVLRPPLRASCFWLPAPCSSLYSPLSTPSRLRVFASSRETSLCAFGLPSFAPCFPLLASRFTLNSLLSTPSRLVY